MCFGNSSGNDEVQQPSVSASDQHRTRFQVVCAGSHQLDYIYVYVYDLIHTHFYICTPTCHMCGQAQVPEATITAALISSPSSQLKIFTCLNKLFEKDCLVRIVTRKFRKFIYEVQKQ